MRGRRFVVVVVVVVVEGLENGSRQQGSRIVAVANRGGLCCLSSHYPDPFADEIFSRITPMATCRIPSTCTMAKGLAS
jgi:hypothetical protein